MLNITNKDESVLELLKPEYVEIARKILYRESCPMQKPEELINETCIYLSVRANQGIKFKCPQDTPNRENLLKAYVISMLKCKAKDLKKDKRKSDDEVKIEETLQLIDSNLLESNRLEEDFVEVLAEEDYVFYSLRLLKKIPEQRFGFDIIKQIEYFMDNPQLISAAEINKNKNMREFKAVLRNAKENTEEWDIAQAYKTVLSSRILRDKQKLNEFVKQEAKNNKKSVKTLLNKSVFNEKIKNQNTNLADFNNNGKKYTVLYS